VGAAAASSIASMAVDNINFFNSYTPSYYFLKDFLAPGVSSFATAGPLTYSRKASPGKGARLPVDRLLS
jgi:hypothetical protein